MLPFDPFFFKQSLTFRIKQGHMRFRDADGLILCDLGPMVLIFLSGNLAISNHLIILLKLEYASQ